MGTDEYTQALEAQWRIHDWWHSAPGREHIGEIADMLTGVLFQRIDTATDPVTAAGTVLCSQLRHATPFYVAPYITPLLEHSLASLPSWQLTTAALPAECGWLWYGAPPLLPTNRHLGKLSHQWGREAPVSRLRALAWRLIGPDSMPVRSATPQVHLMAYLDCRVCPIPELASMLVWPIGRDWQVVEPRDGPTGGHADAPFWRALQGHFASLLLFIEQRILKRGALQAARGARRRAERAGRACPPIQVVHLRRVVTAQGPSRLNAPEWHCQWLVRGHWRQQWYPKAQLHQPRWIMPHVKGPEDKPFRGPRSTVFAVVR